MHLGLQKIRNKLGKISLVIVPLFFTLSELFHPKTMDTIIGEIESAEKYREVWFMSHIFALISIIFIPTLITKIISFIDKNRIIYTGIFYFISNIGLIGITGLLGYDFLLYDAWVVNNDHVISQFLTVINDSVYGFIFLKIGPILFIFSFLALVILMLISNKAKKWKTILIVIGTLIYGFTGPLIPVSNGHILVSFGAAVMLIGFIGLLVSDAR